MDMEILRHFVSLICDGDRCVTNVNPISSSETNIIGLEATCMVNSMILFQLLFKRGWRPARWPKDRRLRGWLRVSCARARCRRSTVNR